MAQKKSSEDTQKLLIRATQSIDQFDRQVTESRSLSRSLKEKMARLIRQARPSDAADKPL